MIVAIAVNLSGERDKMRAFADMDIQARLMREMRELYEIRGKLEAGIRAVEEARNVR